MTCCHLLLCLETLQRTTSSTCLVRLAVRCLLLLRQKESQTSHRRPTPAAGTAAAAAAPVTAATAAAVPMAGSHSRHTCGLGGSFPEEPKALSRPLWFASPQPFCRIACKTLALTVSLQLQPLEAHRSKTFAAAPPTRRGKSPVGCTGSCSGWRRTGCFTVAATAAHLVVTWRPPHGSRNSLQQAAPATISCCCQRIRLLPLPQRKQQQR